MSALQDIELHLHLEGAAAPDFVRSLAARKSVTLPGVFDEAGAYAFRDFADFLRVYEIATAVIETPEDYAALVTHVLERQAEAGILYTELFASPDFCGGGELAGWRDFLHAMDEAMRAAESRLGTMARLTVTAVRHFGPDRARAAAICAAETAGARVTGFGMGGDERIGHPSDFAWAFDCAREAGLGLTVHAGEWDGPASVRDALDALRPARIGHGVRAIEDRLLVDRLARDGIVLEVCPGSNLALGLYADLRAHPVAQLREAGVPVTIATDDPPFFHTTMPREWERLEKALGWDADDRRALRAVAARAAFCDPATREILLTALESPDE